MKKIIIISSILILLIVGLFSLFTTGKFCFSKEKRSIQNTVEICLQIQHGWRHKSKLEDISTEKFRNDLDENSFYQNNKLYSIDRKYMDSYYKIDKKTVEVRVSVYAPDIKIIVFTLIKYENKYLIDNIEYDL